MSNMLLCQKANKSTVRRLSILDIAAFEDVLNLDTGSSVPLLETNLYALYHIVRMKKGVQTVDNVYSCITVIKMEMHMLTLLPISVDYLHNLNFVINV